MGLLHADRRIDGGILSHPFNREGTKIPLNTTVQTTFLQTCDFNERGYEIAKQEQSTPSGAFLGANKGKRMAPR